MLDIVAIIKTIVEMAGEVHRHLSDRQRAKQETERSKAATAVTSRLDDLEESDLEQAQLLDELARNTAQLGKALEVEVERNRARDAWAARMVYATLAISIIALALGLVALLR